MFERIQLAMAGRVRQRDELKQCRLQPASKAAVEAGAKRLDCAKDSGLHIECWWHHALAMWHALEWCFFAHPGKQMQITMQKEAP